ncbi:MAG: hypothetical protein AAF438_09820, partial [Pseudomonadota bacterium]
ITAHADGTRRLRSRCEMQEDDLLRDVFLCVDTHWRPVVAHVNLMVSGQFVGSSHYVFSEDIARIQSYTVRDGYHVQKTKLDRPPPSFGSHAVQNDAWFYAAFDQIRMGTHPGFLESVPITSKLPNGGDGPGIQFSRQQHRYVGDETIEVAAGQFETRHYEFIFDQWPSIHYWISGEDYLLVKCRWDHLKQTYELTQLDKTG